MQTIYTIPVFNFAEFYLVDAWSWFLEAVNW